MKQLVEAAIKMHSEGVFHRDIKSENVLVETESDVPRVRLIDFGCGCFVRKIPLLRWYDIWLMLFIHLLISGVMTFI